MTRDHFEEQSAHERESAILVKNLRRTYGDFAAVDGIDLDIKRGEVYSLLGPNGAGKSTTIEILCGARNRTSGDVNVLGYDPGKFERGFRARVGVVPQTTAEYLDLTVTEVVKHFATFYPNSWEPAEVISAVGLGEKAKAMCTNLSGGQKHRLDVAVGLVGKPELVFLDEPTTGLDPEARREAWDLIRTVQQMGTTVILTTHYLDEAEELSDRVGVIARGRILVEGTVQELSRVAGFSHRISTTSPELRLPDATDPNLAKELVRDGSGVSWATDHPTAVLRGLLEQADRAGFDEIPGLTVARPTLEDTYLALLHKDESATENNTEEKAA